MIKAEPKTILNFIAYYFEIVRELFDVQKNEGIIRRETLDAILEKKNKEIKPQLLDYKILKNINDDFELRDVYYNLLAFVLFEFRPLLPQEIEKFGNAISELFRLIKEDSQDKNILLDRIKALTAEVREFLDAVEKNTIRLLNETRELKANVEKIDYAQKVQKASYWIQYYISPLNKILDVNHSESITNKLSNISEYVNQKRLYNDDEGIRKAFEKLYYFLRDVNDTLLKQSKILTNELIPLIERLKTENMILTGWIEFLKNPYKLSPPSILKADKDNRYSNLMYFNTKEYFEDLENITPTVIDENMDEKPRWVFNKDRYKKQLSDRLPLDNFFDWCKGQLDGENVPITNEKVFALTRLLFETDFEVGFSEKEEMIKLTTETSQFYVPKLNIKYNGVSRKS